jgi:hypothetical protein
MQRNTEVGYTLCLLGITAYQMTFLKTLLPYLVSQLKCPEDSSVNMDHCENPVSYRNIFETGKQKMDYKRYENYYTPTHSYLFSTLVMYGTQCYTTGFSEPLSIQ